MIYAANWKMNKDPRESINFVENNAPGLKELTNNNTIIICPSFIALSSLAIKTKPLGLALGGQDCSDHSKGAFTGQAAAHDIATTGATYCIVGHSECRNNNNDSSERVAEKCLRVIENNMTPIVCIGETAQEHHSNKTETVLAQQLAPIMSITNKNTAPIIIAYEPVWAIGTGLTPTTDHLRKTFIFLFGITTKLPGEAQLLYGGSITSKNAASLKEIPHLEGFLIGGSSLDFQELKKIVEC